MAVAGHVAIAHNVWYGTYLKLFLFLKEDLTNRSALYIHKLPFQEIFLQDQYRGQHLRHAFVCISASALRCLASLHIA